MVNTAAAESTVAPSAAEREAQLKRIVAVLRPVIHNSESHGLDETTEKKVQQIAHDFEKRIFEATPTHAEYKSSISRRLLNIPTLRGPASTPPPSAAEQVALAVPP